MTYHCIIVGGGIAALQLAHHLKRDMDILLLTKGEIRSSNTYRAQGGIAAAVGQGDSPALHYNDTIQAGRDFHNYKEVADLVKEPQPQLLRVNSLDVGALGAVNPGTALPAVCPGT